MELNVFSRPDVAAAMSRFTLLRVDLSEEDDALAAIKRKYGAETLPAIRIVSPAGAIVARTDQQLSPERFLSLLATVP
jgi:thiol:disulfide interchange protein